MLQQVLLHSADPSLPGVTACAWSPRGDVVACMYMNQLFVVDIYDLDVRHSIGLPDVVTSIRWAPDGNRLLCSTTDRIYVVTLDVAGKPTILATGTGAVWSPDGRRVAFVSNQGLFAMDVTGGRIEGLSAPFLEPDWAPRGNRIVGTRDDNIFVVNLDDNSCERLGAKQDIEPIGGSVWGAHPKWSPSGNMIAFDQVTWRALVCIMESNGENPHVVAEGVIPQWSFDGAMLLMQNVYQSRISVVGSDGSGYRDLGEGRTPTWNPNGTSIAFSSGGDILLLEL